MGICPWKSLRRIGLSVFKFHLQSGQSVLAWFLVHVLANLAGLYFSLHPGGWVFAYIILLTSFRFKTGLRFKKILNIFLKPGQSAFSLQLDLDLDFQSPEPEETDFCCFSHPVYRVSLWQLWQINTTPFPVTSLHDFDGLLQSLVSHSSTYGHL